MGSIIALFSAQTDEYWWRYEFNPVIPVYFGGRRGGSARHEDESTALLLGHKHCTHRALACGKWSTPIFFLLGKMCCAKGGFLYVGRGGRRTEGTREREGMAGNP